VLGVPGVPLVSPGPRRRRVEFGQLAAEAGHRAPAAPRGRQSALEYIGQQHHRAERDEGQRGDLAGNRVKDAADGERREHRQDREAGVLRRLWQFGRRERQAGETGSNDR